MPPQVQADQACVADDASVRRADSVQAGVTHLLTESGPSQVIQVGQIDYTGPIWNARPQTQRTLGNIFLVQGFFMGSVRYQEGWLTQPQRCSLRGVHQAPT